MDLSLEWAAVSKEPMFERYTEPARRVIFFARYEASQFGSATIESEHFLLGLIREDEIRLHDFVPTSTTIEAIRSQIQDQIPIHEKISTSIDLPLSDECKRILRNAAEESEGLGHSYVDTSHLLLGILLEGNSFAAKFLAGLGLEITAVREKIRRSPTAHSEAAIGRRIGSMWSSSGGKNLLPAAGVVPNVDTAKRIAEAVWFPKVSAGPGDQLEAVNATLTSGVWIVTGSHRRKDTTTALAAFIQKEDGRILRLHTEKSGS